MTTAQGEDTHLEDTTSRSAIRVAQRLRMLDGVSHSEQALKHGPDQLRLWMRPMTVRIFVFIVLATASLFSQQATVAQPATKRHTSAKHDVGTGAGDIGKGVGKGAASAAKGTGKAAGHLATLHAIDAAGDLGRGAAGAGKNVGVGAAKGTGKIIRGTGKAIKHIF